MQRYPKAWTDSIRESIVRTTLAGRCVRRTTSPTTSTAAWARDVVARPARYRATQHEAALIADLLAQLGGAR